ncbi:MAG: response regulator transcription factor [Planctomycetota bacterium]
MGLELYKTSNMRAAKEMVKKHYYHLILMDFDTIGKQIFNFCSFIRSGSYHTILIALMSSVKIDTEEQLFNCGVNDVVTGKQVSARILVRRIRSHLLHSYEPSWAQTNIIRLKDTLVNFKRREVWCNQTIRRLSGILSDLLKYFLDNPDRVISRKELFNSPVWADSICSSVEDGGKTFDVNIGKLRKVIESDPVRPQIIISVRGIGWKLADGCVREREKQCISKGYKNEKTI